ncbi:MAG TPA: hypothetical protein P5247_03550 [Candidatus Saccharimonadales bacterium]|nr:hypothetical protein [Candidatus Saccharimonadales bacterium]
MFTERILEMTDNPVILAEQKMTVPTERLVRALSVAEVLGLGLVNLTYFGAPFVDPKRGDFDLLKPRILTTNGIITPQLSKYRSGSIGSLTTSWGTPLTTLYRGLMRLRAGDFRLSLGQIRWLLDPQEFDMTDFYLLASGRSEPTKDSIAADYLPNYYRELAEAQIPLIVDYSRKSKSSKNLIDEFGVTIIDLEDYDPCLDYSTPQDFSQRSYIDLSNTQGGGLPWIE